MKSHLQIYLFWHGLIISTRYFYTRDFVIPMQATYCFQIGHSLLPHHSFHLSFKSFYLFVHRGQSVCDFNYIIFNYPFISTNKYLLLIIQTSLDYLCLDSNLYNSHFGVGSYIIYFLSLKLNGTQKHLYLYIL